MVQKVDQLHILIDGKKEDIERVKDEYKLDDSDIATVDDVVEEKVEQSPKSEIKNEHASDE